MNKKINIKIIAILLSLFMVFSFDFVSNARVIYKDINSISIRTNFNFDFDSISEDGLPDISPGTADGESNDYNVYVSSSAKYQIESAEWYSQGDRDFEIGGSPRVVVYLTTKDYDEYNNYNNNSSNDYYYRFLSSYSSSNCYISKGTFISAQRLSTSNLKDRAPESFTKVDMLGMSKPGNNKIRPELEVFTGYKHITKEIENKTFKSLCKVIVTTNKGIRNENGFFLNVDDVKKYLVTRFH